VLVVVARIRLPEAFVAAGDALAPDAPGVAVFVPLLLTVGTLAGAWWYVVIYNAAPTTAAVTAAAAKPAPIVAPPAATAEQSQEVGMAGDPTTETDKQEGGEEVTSFRDTTASTAGRIPAHFYQWFWASAIVCGLLLLWYFWRMNGEQLEILKELIVSVVPLGVLTVVVLVVILFGICTATVRTPRRRSPRTSGTCSSWRSATSATSASAGRSVKPTTRKFDWCTRRSTAVSGPIARS